MNEQDIKHLEETKPSSLIQKNELLLEEIRQFHSVVKDFSIQSTSIKRLSITLIISFLALCFGVPQGYLNMTATAFFIIGLAIPVFSFIYEIYVDAVRQSLRIEMQSRIISYQEVNGFEEKEFYKQGVSVKRLFGIYWFKDKKFSEKVEVVFLKKNLEEKFDASNLKPFYVNFSHRMYIIYLIELAGVVAVGVSGVLAGVL